MNTLVPGYLYAYMLVGDVAMVVAVLVGLSASLTRARWASSDRRRAFGAIGGLFLGWWITSLNFSWRGVFQGAAFRAPTLQYGLLIPILTGVVLYLRWPQLRRVVDVVPQSWLVSVQLYRVLGVIFLILHFQGKLPWQFAWPAGAGDVVVGLTAPLVAWGYANRLRGTAAWVRRWNWLGIADLVVAVTTGFLTSPSPIQLLALDSPNRLISAFPLVTIPVFLVPMSILFHFASLKKLREEESAASPIGFGEGRVAN